MNDYLKIRNVLTIILLALALGVIFDYLFFEKAIGVSVLVFTTTLLAVLYWLCAKFKYDYRSSLWLATPVIFFALMPAIRANMFLNFLNVLAIIGLLLLTTKEILREPIRKFRLQEYFQTIFIMPFGLLLASLRPLKYAINAFRQSSSGKWRRVVIGVVMALPVLVVFTLLFSSADLAFRQFIESIISVNLPDVFFGHAFVITVISVILLGTMEYIFRPTTNEPIVPVFAPPETTTQGREVETGVFLSLIAGLFLIFIIFQITYLFGGEANIINRGITYAEYARHGFWELLVVSFATLVILFFTDKSTRREISRKVWFTVPACIIILETMGIMTSSFKRLMLYQNTYGMTTLRFYVAVFILFLGVAFATLAIKFILEKKESFFTFAVLLAMIGFLAGVNLINPDAFIAKNNIARFNETGKIDVSYLTNLSPDAVPQVIAVYDKLNDLDKNTAEGIIRANLKRWKSSSAPWQSYNFATANAIHELQSFPR
ncbi:MAG: DUF4173 domain-containing protein [Candidatus Doudnabacteria bacterium]|nr:DUF4173 domain-containing protein [Candidatus Doudnabacteria bacterium]